MKAQRLRYQTATLPRREIEVREFRVGQRVRHNELGIARSPRSTARVGTVVGLPGTSTVSILFDGNKMPTRLHRSYVEKIDED